MWRTILAVVGGLVAWTLVATLLNIGVRHALPGYSEAEPALAFTLSMKIARLSLAIIASVAAGAVARSIAPASKAAPWIAGFILLALFLPVHIQIWSLLPVWYHLFFLVTLAPSVALGAMLRFRGSGGSVAPSQA
jgi:hypothetical protein